MRNNFEGKSSNETRSRFNEEVGEELPRDDQEGASPAEELEKSGQENIEIDHAEIDRMADEVRANLMRMRPMLVSRDGGAERPTEGTGRGRGEVGTFTMLRSLWGTAPSDAKLALIKEFIFNPVALKNRYQNEKAFQTNLRGRWRK